MSRWGRKRSRYMRPWFPPLQETQERGTHSHGGIGKPEATRQVPCTFLGRHQNFGHLVGHSLIAKIVSIPRIVGIFALIRSHLNRNRLSN